MQITIELPLPPGALAPNRRPHWRQKAHAIGQYRGAARIVALSKMNACVRIPAGSEFPWSNASARVVWNHSGQQPDRDNALASLKAAFDGIADAGVIANDRELVHLPMTMIKVDRGNEGVLIFVERCGESACPLCHRPYDVNQ